jgi:hypothetical protein
MQPRNVDSLRHLQWEAAKATKKLREFEAVSPDVPAGNETLCTKERFEKLWDTLTPLMADTREDELIGFNGMTPIHRIITGQMPQVYALSFDVVTDRFHERQVGALWRYYGPVSPTGRLRNPGGEFEHRECLSEQEVEDWPDSEETLHKLADLEWSLKAYQEAEPKASPQT